jgi:hypothetical protein
MSSHASSAWAPDALLAADTQQDRPQAGDIHNLRGMGAADSTALPSWFRRCLARSMVWPTSPGAKACTVVCRVSWTLRRVGHRLPRQSSPHRDIEATGSSGREIIPSAAGPTSRRCREGSSSRSKSLRLTWMPSGSDTATHSAAAPLGLAETGRRSPVFEGEEPWHESARSRWSQRGRLRIFGADPAGSSAQSLPGLIV